MSKSIIICSDGTGNSFKQRRSNVARLLQLIDLRPPANQIAVYDQGIGTDAARGNEIEAFHASLENPDALIVLRDPLERDSGSRGRVDRVRGMAFGHGLAENVRQMYQPLGRLYEDGDSVYLFGFSRGAFTVRALAGLLHRCGLPRKESAERADLFDRAWRLYQPMQPHKDATTLLWRDEGQRECKIYFLGIWDTVKSYGGLRPVLLPHLRHNPIVSRVRHALALDEKRGWFDATTWGRLDMDKEEGKAWSRLAESGKSKIDAQSIEEVWFRGCHSDVGGGDDEQETARVALYWMLGEVHEAGLKLNVVAPLPPEPFVAGEAITIHESYDARWRAVDCFPRTVIDNSDTWPTTKWPRVGSASRRPYELLRSGKATFHESVGLEEGPHVRVVGSRRGYTNPAA